MTNYTINVEDSLWKKFKDNVSKSKTMNNAIVELIKKEVGDKHG